MNVLRIELRRSAAALALPFLAVVGGAAVFAKLTPGVALWPNVNAEVNLSLMLLAPLTAGLAAWCGGRESRRRASYLRQLSARSPGTVASTEMIAVLLWCLLAYSLVIGVAFAVTATRAHAGSPSISWTAEAMAGLALFVPIGFVIGRLVRSRFTAPGLAVLTYVALAVGQVKFGSTWATSLSPVTSVTGDVFQRFNALMGWGQVLWLLGLAGLLTACWCWAMDRRGNRRLLPALTVAVVLTAGASSAGAVTVESQHGQVYRGSSTFTYACSTVSLTICVHPAFRDALPALAPAFSLLHLRLQGTPADFHEVRQSERAGNPPLGYPVISFGIDDLRPGFADAAVSEVVATGFLPACSEQAGQTIGDSHLLQTMVVAWLQTSVPSSQASAAEAAQVAAGFDSPNLAPAIQRFLRMTEDDRRNWLRTRYSQFHRCGLSATSITN